MRFVTSYEPNYFSIENIVATQSPIPCKIEMKIAHLGDLDPGCQSQDLESGRRIDLPAWIAFILKNRHLISVDLSKAYSRNAREILKAEPSVVDLMKQEAFFYELGHLLCGLEPDDDLKQCLLQTFQIRSKEVISLSQAPLSTDVVTREGMLSREEREILNLGRERYNEIESWLSGKIQRSAEVAAPSVSSYRKRKRPVDSSETS